MFIIHAGFHINPAKEEEFLKEVRSVIEASRSEEGNISYDLLKDTETEHVYTMVEVWKDGAAVESHNKSSHFTSFVGKAPEFLTAPLDLKIYTGDKIEK
ncbi:putative quinol monooxygenase [Guptibacillus spartinae]|uniref:putative quinol monooxygenase n=1 Tax=Guptibacillus spartinae TaxID=3025679 RepID=UPI00236277F2|nr:putative quinol monooxygenase [Pseudalkalibacillus spartinae]